MSTFNLVKVKDIKKETDDAVSIAFDVDFNNQYKYEPGQYIVVKATINNEEIRRSYSLCSAPYENDFRVVVKKVVNGKMSNFLNQTIKIGDELEVMTPSGNFVPKNLTKNIVGFAAGSGITPVFSILKSVIKAGGKFTLFYGNVNESSTIYKSELDKLAFTHSNQLSIVYTYDEGKQLGLSEINSGRIDTEKMQQFIQNKQEILLADDYFICGPEPMINTVKEALLGNGIAQDKVHFELFSATKKDKEQIPSAANGFKGISKLTVIMDGEETNFELAANGKSILDASMDNGIDAPFSCKGAVCCTCKALVVEGKAIMEMNYALSESEVAQGYILTCQAHPASDKLVVDFDVT